MKDDGKDIFHIKCVRQSKTPKKTNIKKKHPQEVVVVAQVGLTIKKTKKMLMTLVAKCVVNELVHSPHPNDASKNAGQIQQKSNVTASLQGLTKSLTSKQQMTFMEE